MLVHQPLLIVEMLLLLLLVRIYWVGLCFQQLRTMAMTMVLLRSQLQLHPSIVVGFFRRLLLVK